MYSDGRPVKASDFEHALRRVLKLGSPGAFLYERIVGAVEYEKRGEPEADIEGIETDDRTRRITIRLDRPYAAFEHLLAVPFAAPVPADTPFREHDETAAAGHRPVHDHEVGAGASVRAGAQSRVRVAGDRGRARGEARPDHDEDHPSKPTLAQDVLTGKLDYMCDSPPPDLLPTVKEQAGERYEEHPTANTNWFFLNGRLPPFDDPRVREAVNYAVDKAAAGAGLRAASCRSDARSSRPRCPATTRSSTRAAARSATRPSRPTSLGLAR